MFGARRLSLGNGERVVFNRGITLLSVVGKCFVKCNRLVQCLDKGGVLHEGQAGFRVNRSCMDNVDSLKEIFQAG